MKSYIEVDHVSKKFGKDTALYDVCLDMEQGKAYGICGNNGSGKTVLMKCICGFLPVTEGKVFVAGKQIGAEIDFPESIGVIIETPGFLTNLSGRKNLEILAGLRGKISKTEICAAMERAGLNPNLKKAVSKYSLGMRQRLGIAQAIMENPDLLVLDEPFNGLDQQGAARIKRLLLDLKAPDRLILLTSHISGDMEELSDFIFEFREKKILPA